MTLVGLVAVRKSLEAETGLAVFKFGVNARLLAVGIFTGIASRDIWVTTLAWRIASIS